MLRCVLAVSAALLLLPSAARADSIAYTKDGNVWLATSDGARQVVLTGSGDLERVSQAADGTLAALRKVPRPGRAVPPRELVRMDRAGLTIGTPFFPLGSDADNASYLGPLDARLSPNGQRAAFGYSYSGSALPAGPRFSITWSDRVTPRSTWTDAGGYLNPFWVDDDRVGVFPQSLAADVQVYDLVADAFQDWFEDPDVDLGGGEIAPGGGAFAAAGTRSSDGASIIRLYALSGPPPAVPEPRCDLSGPVGSFFRPTFSPDARSLAWQEDDGIHVGSFDLATCEGTERLTIPGGQAPDWAAADVPKAAGPAPGGAPGGTVPGATSGAAPALAATLHAPDRVRLTALLRGITVKVGCTKPCRARATLVVPRSVAKRLRLKAPHAVATATRSLTRTAKLRLAPAARLRAGLRRVRPRALTVKLVVVAGGETRRLSRVVRIR